MPQSLYPDIKFQLQEQIYDSKALLDETNFYAQRQGQPSELTKTLTYILGSYSKNYPVSLMTMGGLGYGLNESAKELDDVQYTYPVMGHDTKASIVYSSEYGALDKPGVGHSRFYITFEDNWIKRFYIIQSELGIQAYVHDDGVPLPSGGYRYECQLDAVGPEDFCDPSQLEQGVKWIDLTAHVAESESRNTESKMTMPGSFKNQMGFIRAGMSWAGNAANKVMRINVQTDKGSTDMWMDLAMWQFEKRWLEENEHAFWYSRYNRLGDGSIPLKDALTGKVIPRGSGMLEQIINKSSTAEVTYKGLVSKIGDALYGMNDTQNMSLTLWGGTGARRDFHRMVMREGAQYIGPLGAGNIADKFVTGTGRNLMLGGFFDGFYHIDGYTIKFKHNPVYDIGRIAKASPLHPKSGLPLESHRMTFIDDSDVDGQPNIQCVTQKGRDFIEGVLRGLTPMPKSLMIKTNGNTSNERIDLGTVQDKSEYTRMASRGIQLLRGNRCFDIQCIAGL